MYQRWGWLQHRDGLEAYLHRTVVRLWIDETRRRRHRDTLVAEPPETQEHADPAVPDPGLLRALRRLPPRQRACVVLRYFNDLSVAQTAELLGCTTGTVKSQTSRALDTLRAHLGVDVVDAVETKEKSE
jgi:RNA polymerase sigma factor (sigma-70 family)